MLAYLMYYLMMLNGKDKGPCIFEAKRITPFICIECCYREIPSFIYLYNIQAGNNAFVIIIELLFSSTKNDLSIYAAY